MKSVGVPVWNVWAFLGGMAVLLCRIVVCFLWDWECFCVESVCDSVWIRWVLLGGICGCFCVELTSVIVWNR